jgi:hypothetical protein
MSTPAFRNQTEQFPVSCGLRHSRSVPQLRKLSLVDVYQFVSVFRPAPSLVREKDLPAKIGVTAPDRRSPGRYRAALRCHLGKPGDFPHHIPLTRPRRAYDRSAAHVVPSFGLALAASIAFRTCRRHLIARGGLRPCLSMVTATSASPSFAPSCGRTCPILVLAWCTCRAGRHRSASR